MTPGMTNKPTHRAARAGGFLLAISIMIGSVAGFVRREPSIGFLGGAAIGIALTFLVWLSERRR